MATKSKSKSKKTVSKVDPKQPETDRPVDTTDTITEAEAEIISPNKSLVQSDAAQSQSIVAGVTTDQLKIALTTQTEQRALIKDFVKNHLTDGTDFGKIHVMSKDKCPDQHNCKKDHHFSKAVLFKPGQEKLFSLFQITDTLERDNEAFDMLPDIRNLVAYKCVLTRNGVKIGEGRGAAVVGDKSRDVNSTIKIAEKRARMDACLSLGFSEYFTQDLDDPDYKSQAEMANQRAAYAAESQDKDEFGLFPRDEKLPIDGKERAVLHRIMLKNGFSEYDEIAELLRMNGIEDPATITSGEARIMMSKLTYSTFAAPERPPEPPPPPEPPTAAPISVDDEFKANVQEQYNQIGISKRGKMWFMKHVAGKPFANWDRLTDEEWKKAFDTVMAILDCTMDVPPEYMDQPESQDVKNVKQVLDLTGEPKLVLDGAQ